MSRFVTGLPYPRTRALALAMLFWAAAARLNAQVPGIHPDPHALEAWQLDEGLQRELEQSRVAVAAAREAALAAKSELEAAVTAKASASPAQNEASDLRTSPSASAGVAQSDDSNSTGVKVLRRLIAELQAERMELLAHLTAEHPLIRDAEMRLAEYQRQLNDLTGDTPADPSASAPPLGSANNEQLRIVVEEQLTAETDLQPGAEQAARQSPPEDSLRLEQALANWESAQAELDAALDRESATADRIAALMALQAKKQSQPARALAAPPEVAEHAAASATPLREITESEPVRPAVDAAARGSQPLVLVAFVIALLVAAVASIKLARATDQSLFSGADDAAAALSLPVVGVIPAGSTAAHGSLFARHRTILFLIQMLAAVAVFALVAFLVQSPGAIWHLLSAPLDSWR